MPKSVIGQKTFDINVDGLAHVGMLPDFIADWQAQGLTEDDLGPLLRSRRPGMPTCGLRWMPQWR